VCLIRDRVLSLNTCQVRFVADPTPLLRIIELMGGFLDRLLGTSSGQRRRRAADVPIDRGGDEVQGLREALRHYAREAALSARTRDGLREIEELKRQLRERAAALAERERELDGRERELEQLARELRGSRRRRRSDVTRRSPRGEPADSEG